MILPKKDVSYVAVYMIKFTGFNKFDQVNLAVENSFLTVKWKEKMGGIIFRYWQHVALIWENVGYLCSENWKLFM